MFRTSGRAAARLRAKMRAWKITASQCSSVHNRREHYRTLSHQRPMTGPRPVIFRRCASIGQIASPFSGAEVSGRHSSVIVLGFTAIAALAFVFGCRSALASRRGLATSRRYFNAELLHVTHRISCPAPGRSSTARKPLVRLRTRRCDPTPSETVPVPVRPQCGQQSATTQVFNAVIVKR